MKNFINNIIKLIPNFLKNIKIHNNELTIYTNPKDIKPLLVFLKNHFSSNYTVITDITAIDYPSNKKRFTLVYNLLSIVHNSRITICFEIKETEQINSIVDIFPGANWYEREVWDMFGIYFKNHPDLRRILTDYGFQGYPLRKDFPLSGYLEVRYDDSEKRLIVEPVELAQSFRKFTFNSPWEQINKD